MRRTFVWVAAALAALTVSACATDIEEDDAESQAEAIASARCGGVSASRTVRVKVMTLNLRHDSDDWKRRFPLIADDIVRLDPDVIGLQEIEIADDQADYLNDLIAKRGHAKYQIHQRRKPGIRGWFTGEGVGIMSRWEITEKTHEDLPEMRTSVRTRVKHPSGKFIDFANTHLHAGGGADGDAIRAEQAKQVVSLVDRDDDCWPTFISGDMNANETSAALANFRGAGFVDSFKKVHGAETSTIGNTSSVVLQEGAFTQNPKRRIDFILGRSAGARSLVPVESVVCLKNHDAKGFYPSDHFGVMTTYEVKL
jgi:endonuclease/exonuclease/phosphatase family metal-dependent hydrolase